MMRELTIKITGEAGPGDADSGNGSLSAVP